MNCFFFSIISVLSLSYGQRVDVEPKQLDVLEGQTREFVCRLGAPIRTCRINFPSYAKGINIFSDLLNIPSGFTFNGQGLEAGECGLRFVVKKEYSGVINCTLVGQSGEDNVGSIPIVLTGMCACCNSSIEFALIFLVFFCSYTNWTRNRN